MLHVLSSSVVKQKGNKLEKLIRRNSYDSDRGEPLQRITQTPRSRWGTGEIEHPSVKTRDGTTYTFTSAKFTDRSFVIAIKVQPKDGESQEAEYTVPQLMEMLAENLRPQRPTLGQRILRTIKRSN